MSLIKSTMPDTFCINPIRRNVHQVRAPGDDTLLYSVSFPRSGKLLKLFIHSVKVEVQFTKTYIVISIPDGFVGPTEIVEEAVEIFKEICLRIRPDLYEALCANIDTIYENEAFEFHTFEKEAA
ncbi:hypothetical protein EUV02_15460 [Polymorphobacter arshaanensis]|uniref:Uncharacterized protein n=1 Tax=Glacieibacterium arshaanense TaxID=2511025 RepID=A0A4Y9EJV2_9SPHN|nr:hypothetical protein [Polymorphobacter arshaanensis]TFU00043.1 hypothetical protein EUV02_15460 [Polymorphobacter arshaanensis]